MSFYFSLILRVLLKLFTNNLLLLHSWKFLQIIKLTYYWYLSRFTISYKLILYNLEWGRCLVSLMTRERFVEEDLNEKREINYAVWMIHYPHLVLFWAAGYKPYSSSQLLSFHISISAINHINTDFGVQVIHRTFPF